MSEYVVGIDFGSDSVRAIIIDIHTGEEIASEAEDYPRWMEGKYCDSTKNMFRQHPLDYIESFENVMKNVIAGGSNAVGKPIGSSIRGIGVDATGSTPCPVNENGIPLALLPEFSENPNAMFYLWKDHTAIREAKEINAVLKDFKGEDYTRFQGEYASEWYWAKILHAARTDNEVKEASYSWVEHCDWFPAMLSGNTNPKTMYRSSCAAGHKALWHSDFEGLPAYECFGSIDPYLEKMARNYGTKPQYATHCLGKISKEWVSRLGISEDCVIGGSSLDAHAGAVGAGIDVNILVMVLGTSAVDMLIEKRDKLRGKDIKEACGMAENSIIPEYIGIESSQAAFGDVYSWFRDILMWPVKNFVEQCEFIPKEEKKKCIKTYKKELLDRLTEMLDINENDELISLDWLNGRRYPNINEKVKGGIYGITLSTDAVKMFKSLILSTAFGARRILESFVVRGIEINKIITVGGVSQKSPYIMQTLADVLQRPIQVSKSKQACARGAAIYAAVAAGYYKDIQEAQKSMCIGFSEIYEPKEDTFSMYNELYKKYLKVGRHFEDIQMNWDKKENER